MCQKFFNEGACAKWCPWLIAAALLAGLAGCATPPRRATNEALADCRKWEGVVYGSMLLSSEPSQQSTGCVDYALHVYRPDDEPGRYVLRLHSGKEKDFIAKLPQGEYEVG